MILLIALICVEKPISPYNPVVQKGVQLNFTCQTTSPEFKSTNQRVANISSSGLLTAVKEGSTIVRCTSNIETTVTVVSLSSVSLKQTNDHLLYKAEIDFTSTVSNRNVTFASEISYNCK